MPYDFSNFRRWLSLWLVLVGSVGSLKASALSASSVPGSPDEWTISGGFDVTDDGSGNFTLTFGGGEATKLSVPPEPYGVRISYGGPGFSGALYGGQSKGGLTAGMSINVALEVSYSGWTTVASATITIGDGASYPPDLLRYWIRYQWSNPTQFQGHVLYKEADGMALVLVHQVDLAPGETKIGAFELPNSDPVSVWIKYDGVEEVDYLGWQVAEGVETTISNGNAAPIAGESAEDVPQTGGAVPTNADNPKAPPAGTATGTKTGATSVTVKTSTNPTGGLTENTFENGISQIVNALGKVGSGGAGTVSVSIDSSGTNSRLDAVKTSVDGVKTAVELNGVKLDALVEAAAVQSARDEATQTLIDATPSQGEMTLAGQSAGTAVSAALPSGTGVSAPAGVTGADEPDFTISMPETMGGGTFDLNPFRADRLGGAVGWFRSAVAWLVIVGFGAWMFAETRKAVVDVTVVQQAKGNAVFGGTGGQATAIIAATLITSAVGSAVVALVGWSFGDIGFSAVLSILSSNPLETMPGRAAWMLDKAFPVATMLTALVGRITFNLYVMKLHAVAAAVVRFIVP